MKVDNSWPTGLPNEAEIRAEMARRAEEVPCSPTIKRGDLDQFDRIISFFDAIAKFTDTELYDVAWNLRNGLVPFVPGESHYDASIED